MQVQLTKAEFKQTANRFGGEALAPKFWIEFVAEVGLECGLRASEIE